MPTVTSKKLIGMPAASTICTYGAMSSYVSTKRSALTGSPSSTMRSRIDSRCGLVNRPTRRPNPRRSSSIIRAVVVLPLVPATWTTGMARCGEPSRSTRALMRVREGSSRLSGQRASSSFSTRARSPVLLLLTRPGCQPGSLPHRTARLHPAARRRRLDHALAEGEQAHGGQLERGDPEGDADDRQAEADARHDVDQREPPAGEQEPEHVADRRGDPRPGRSDRGPPERPHDETGEPEGGDAERDGHDEQAGDDPGEQVGEGEEPPLEHEPDDVEQHPHRVHGGLTSAAGPAFPGAPEPRCRRFLG